MKLWLGLGIGLVLFSLYMDSLVPDSVVIHRARVVAANTLLINIHFMEDVLEQLFGVQFYKLYRLSTSPSDNNETVKWHDDVIDGVPVRIYVPHTSKSQELLPGIVYYHGGGFASLSVDSYHRPMLDLAETSNSIIISVDYRLAPEHPFPEGLNDCLTVATGVIANSEKYSISPLKLYLAGDSAGGNLAAVVNGELRSPYIKGVIMIYPVMQLATLNLPSFRTKSFGFITHELVAKYYATYFNVSAINYYREIMNDAHVCDDEDSRYFLSNFLHMEKTSPDCNEELSRQMHQVFDHRVSPLFNEDLSDLSPTLILLAAEDVLVDEGLIYYERLITHGVKASKKVYHSAIHGYFSILGPMLQPTQYYETMADIARYVQNDGEP